MTEEIKRVYELGYILASSISDGEISKEVDMLKGSIEKVDGKVVAEGAPEFIDLAYTMQKHTAGKIAKFSQGYFGWFKFEASPATLEALKKSLDGNTLLVRYIIIKTSIENNIIFKKPKVEARKAIISDEELAVSDEELNEVVDLHNEHELATETTVQSEGSEEEAI